MDDPRTCTEFKHEIVGKANIFLSHRTSAACWAVVFPAARIPDIRFSTLGRRQDKCLDTAVPYTACRYIRHSMLHRFLRECTLVRFLCLVLKNPNNVPNAVLMMICDFVYRYTILYITTLRTQTLEICRV